MNFHKVSEFFEIEETIKDRDQDEFISVPVGLIRKVAEEHRELLKESADLTKALTSLTRQGSEFFIRKGDRYVADIPFCVQDIRNRFETLFNQFKRLKISHEEGN